MTDFEIDPVEAWNEKYLECDLKDHKFGLKGYIDRYVIDHEAKEITIIDFKTTSKSLDKFAETMGVTLVTGVQYLIRAFGKFAVIMQKVFTKVVDLSRSLDLTAGDIIIPAILQASEKAYAQFTIVIKTPII